MRECFDRVLDGLRVLEKYTDVSVCVYEDKIFAGPKTTKEITPEDCDKLRNLGWFISDESWATFVS